MQEDRSQHLPTQFILPDHWLLFGGWLLLCALWPLTAFAQVFESEGQRVRLTILTEGLEHPWSLAFCLTDECWSASARAACG
jgi:hypothetical protein